MRTRVFEVWQYAGKIRGNERVHLPPTVAVRGFDFTHDFRGKSAHFIIVTNDSSISADVALEFAASIQANRFTTMTIEMAHLSQIVKKNGKRQ